MFRSILPVSFGTAAVLAGCASPNNDSRPVGVGEVEETPSAIGDALALLEGEWSLRTIRGRSVEEMLEDAPVRQWPSLRIETDGTVGGWAGVNSWSGSVDPAAVRHAHFDIGSVTSTLMAGPQASMEFEALYKHALEGTKRLDPEALRDGRLVLESAEGESLLVFVPAED